MTGDPLGRLNCKHVKYLKSFKWQYSFDRTPYSEAALFGAVGTRETKLLLSDFNTKHMGSYRMGNPTGGCAGGRKCCLGLGRNESTQIAKSLDPWSCLYINMYVYIHLQLSTVYGCGSKPTSGTFLGWEGHTIVTLCLKAESGWS